MCPVLCSSDPVMIIVHVVTITGVLNLGVLSLAFVPKHSQMYYFDLPQVLQLQFKKRERIQNTFMSIILQLRIKYYWKGNVVREHSTL